MHSSIVQQMMKNKDEVSTAMLDITRKTVTLTLEPQEVMELERIITDEDKEDAYAFLKKYIYRKLAAGQGNHLKSHLDGEKNPSGSFNARNKS